MIIESIRVKNFRSIVDENLACEALTALVGANGSGKSSFLKALDIFYDNSLRITIDDFYNRDAAHDISITVTFKELPLEAKELFKNYIQGDKLSVEKVIAYGEGKPSAKYHGSSLQNPVFCSIRNAASAADKKIAYNEIKANPDYASLPSWTNQGNALTALKEWEIEHQDKCSWLRDDGQFFGFKEVGQGYLGKFTRFLFIPAVKDASNDASEGKGTIFSILMDLAVRSVIANREAMKELKSEVQQKYEELMNPDSLTELKELSKTLTQTIKTFVPDAEVNLEWNKLEEIILPMPKADVKIVEDGYSSAVSCIGHGLQRAFILTILQHLALAQVSSPIKPEEESNKQILPNFVLAIEEPELYQHPSRERHFAKILLQLASGKTPGVAEKTQILYCTHSPLFVGIDRIDQIRLLRKVENGKLPKMTRIIRTSSDEVANSLWELDGKPGDKFNGQTLLPRLQAIMTPWMNEGFFSDVVVLVEGEDDRAAILGMASSMGHELDGYGISVIPCGGKTNLDRPYMIFKNLGIPIFVIWDGDWGKGATEGECEKCKRPLDKKPNPLDNRKLLRLVGQTEEDWPETVVTERSACFKKDLETTLKEEIGEEFDKLLESCQTTFCIQKRRYAIKNPNIISTIITQAKDQGSISKTLVTIVEQIRALRFS